MRGAAIGLIPQEPQAALDPRQTAAGHVRERLRRATPALVADLLAQVALDPARGGEYPFQWSGGMQQRLLVAMALAQRPQLLLADEPTAALDTLRQQELIELLNSLVATGRLPALLVVTHDLDVAARLARTMLVLDQGRLVEQGSARTLLRHPEQAVTRALVARQPAWPVGIGT
jgi:peptide/nickel transport system ATP-binding protein